MAPSMIIYPVLDIMVAPRPSVGSLISNTEAEQPRHPPRSVVPTTTHRSKTPTRHSLARNQCTLIKFVGNCFSQVIGVEGLKTVPGNQAVARSRSFSSSLSFGLGPLGTEARVLLLPSTLFRSLASSTNLLIPIFSHSTSPFHACPLPAHLILHSVSNKYTYPTCEFRKPMASLTSSVRPLPTSLASLTMKYRPHCSSGILFLNLPLNNLTSKLLTQSLCTLTSTLCNKPPLLSIIPFNAGFSPSFPPRNVATCSSAQIPL